MAKMRQAASQPATMMTPTTSGGSTSARADCFLGVAITAVHPLGPLIPAEAGIQFFACDIWQSLGSRVRGDECEFGLGSIHRDLHAVDEPRRVSLLVIDALVEQAGADHEVVGRLPSRVGHHADAHGLRIAAVDDLEFPHALDAVGDLLVAHLWIVGLDP